MMLSGIGSVSHSSEAAVHPKGLLLTLDTKRPRECRNCRPLLTALPRQKIFNCRNAATTLPTRPIVSFRCTVHCCCAKVPHHEAGFDAEEQAMEDQERRTFLRKSGLAVTAAALGDAVLPVSASAQSPNAAPAKAQEMPKGLTRNLARFIVTTRFEDLPENVRHEAKRTLLNWVGCAIGACRQDTVTNVIAA